MMFSSLEDLETVEQSTKTINGFLTVLIKVVKSGNVYTATGDVIDVIDANGVLLGKIHTPTFTATNLMSWTCWSRTQGAVEIIN
jgi:hypothetical protein